MTKKMKFIGSEIFEYEVFKIRDIYDPILKQVSPIFDFSSPPIDPKFLANSLMETMVHHYGIGLAAPQCGLLYRAFSMGGNKTGAICFNPEILSTEGEDYFEEGCLSASGLFLKIKRPTIIKVRYSEFSGVVKEETFTGLTAKIFAHELDHLNGVVFTSLVNTFHLDRAKKKVKRNLKLLAAQREKADTDRLVQERVDTVIAQVTARAKEKATSALIHDIPDDLSIKM